MEPTKLSQRLRPGRLSLDHLILGSLLVLPYASYIGLAGLAVFLMAGLRRWGTTIWQLLYRQGWVLLTLGIGISVLTSQNRAESALQSLNFWPFFVFYGAVATAIGQFKAPLSVLHRWALGLLLATIPISLRAITEFYLKAPTSVARWVAHPWFGWLYLQPDYGFRADSVFGHP
ncbi:MAG: hypothetical protein HC929_12600, partial [Leptolyngbyaceae cyanobacterium SM2_5_2]|nr:hypothetical protein [Leptolyngbyaceae cyanobacterium SM2_5_2]